MEEVVLITAATTAIVELVNRVFKKDWRVVAIIILAAVTGGAIAQFGLTAINTLTGALAGLSASGVITGLTHVGKGITENIKPEEDEYQG